MKRCPQCDFIYEDDQSLCDMDGRQLECVREVSPRQHAAATRLRRAQSPRRRPLPILLSAGVILGVILPLSYYVTTSQTATVRTGHAQVNLVTNNAAAPPPESTPVPESLALTPAPPPEPPATKARPAAAASRKKAGTGVPARGPARKPSPPPSGDLPARAQKPEGANGKKGSKLGAVLKKTGRILKKPFGF